MRMLLLAAALALSACGGDDTAATSADMRAGADFASLCGHPGDKGNSLGVGKYCSKLSDCNGAMANLCSVLGSSNTFFCTFQCSGNPDLGSECGENASCQCQGGQCGCYPSSCH
jgi:hypothetical protein